MDESISRRRAAATLFENAGLTWRHIAALVVALTMFAAVAVALDAAPAQGDTSAQYQRLWNGLSKSNKQWARRTSQCESGGDRNIHGGASGQYHGAFQFTLGTWRGSPKSPGGDPHRYSWKTQAVVAVYLKKRDGTGHWPRCG